MTAAAAVVAMIDANGEQRQAQSDKAAKRELLTPPPSTGKFGHDAGGVHDNFDDRGSTTSKADSAAQSGGFAEADDDFHDVGDGAPLSPPSSTHSRGSVAPAPVAAPTPAAAHSSPKKQHPLRPAYLYVEGEESEPPAEPCDDIKGVPVFTPTWDEFQDFYSYCSRIDEWGMRSGIVKIIPPKEWTDSLPSLDGRQADGRVGERYTEANRLSQVRIKNSIEQLFTPAGVGVWRQSNVVHPSRVINAKQWADICATESQRGPEMKRMLEVARRKKDDAEEDGVRTRSGRGRGSGAAASATTTTATTPTAKSKRDDQTPRASSSTAVDDEPHSESNDSIASRRMLSPRKSATKANAAVSAKVNAAAAAAAAAATPSPASNKPKMAERTTQDEWNAFDYRRDWCKEAGCDAQANDWAMDTCRAIENEYWRGLNYGKPPMYGADLSGTLFTPETRNWNIGTLDNILTRLRLKRKLPGVTTPYLYFGMWRATFAWHVEDMDLYSINYIHFGAPKQWYSIRQADKQRFELAMASAFPADSGRCRHFMRHKSYLASPAFIESAAGRIKPLRLVQKAQEIVLTYPYGYHSGYNLGFNCAESVNFALERWLDIGRKATYCDCTNDSVKMDVDAMLEESDELEELERRRVERERKREEDESMQRTEEEKAEERRAKDRERRKRRREEMAKLGGGDQESSEPAVKKVKAADPFPCELCPSALREDMIVIPGEDGSSKATGPLRRAHRLCASFMPETWIVPNPKAENAGPHSRIPKELVMGFDSIAKARWSLKCQNCQDPAMSKRGAKVQCSFGRCSRTTHVSCALLEENGWMLDVLPDAEADAIEGKTNSKTHVGKGKKSKSAARASATQHSTTSTDETQAAKAEGGNDEDEEAAPRMVVLCRLHNPVERERETKRKAAVLRVCLDGLESGQKICVRTGSGLWETIFSSFEAGAEADDGNVTLIDGSVVKGSKVVFDAETIQKADDVVWYREEAEVLREQQAASSSSAAVVSATAMEVEGEGDGEPEVTSKEQQQRQREEARQLKAAEQAAKKAERDRRAAEKEEKKKERERIKAERDAKRTDKEAKRRSTPITPVVPSQPLPPNDSMKYIRDWKPRDVPLMSSSLPSTAPRPPFPFPILTHRGPGGDGPHQHPIPFQHHHPHQHPQHPSLYPYPYPHHPQQYGTLSDRRMVYASPSYEQHVRQYDNGVAPSPLSSHPAYRNVLQHYSSSARASDLAPPHAHSSR